MAKVGDIKKVKGENGDYTVETLKNGYSITKDGKSMDLLFNEESQTWNVVSEGVSTELMKMKKDGTVWAWGDNTYGQLGQNLLTTYSNTPLPISGLSKVQKIFAGGNQTCALLQDNEILCWGDNQYSQLGPYTDIF